MFIFSIALLTALIVYHARLEWVEGLADYLCGIVHVDEPPRWLAFALSLLAVGILSIPLVGAVLNKGLRPEFLAMAAGGFLGDILSTHIGPTWLTGRRSPALSTWWLYLLAAGGLIAYLALKGNGINPEMFILGLGLFVGLWPSMLGLRMALRRIRKRQPAAP